LVALPSRTTQPPKDLASEGWQKSLPDRERKTKETKRSHLGKEKGPIKVSNKKGHATPLLDTPTSLRFFSALLFLCLFFSPQPLYLVHFVSPRAFLLIIKTHQAPKKSPT
jgi:hypothetical protein